MKGLNNVSIDMPNIANVLVEKQRFDCQTLQNELVSINEMTNNSNTNNSLFNIVTQPDNIEDVASLLEVYFEEFSNQSTTFQTNNSQVSQRSTTVNTFIENDPITIANNFSFKGPSLNEHNSENEGFNIDEPLVEQIDSNSTSEQQKQKNEWSLNIGEPTELIIIRKFAKSFSNAFEREISEMQSVSSSSKKLTKSQYREIAEKCSQFFADPTLFSLLRQYYSIDGDKIQNGSNSGSIALPPLSSSRIEETNGSGSHIKNKDDDVICRSQSPATSSKKRKAISDECNGQDGQESSLRTQSNKRVKRRNKKDARDNSSNIASSSFSETSNIIVPTVSISSITAKSRKGIDPSERPELSAMENRFWEMAALLDSSPLASLNSKYRAPAPSKKRHDLNYVSSIINKKSDNIKNIDISGDPEVVLSVAFYNQSNPVSRTQEFLVLGSQPLTALRDAFYCISDFYKQEASELSASINALNSSEEKKSGSYFFIEDVFYNDCRDKDALDYSKEIIDWVNENERYAHPGLGLYQRKKMEEVKFSDLSIRLNKPYIFVHKEADGFDVDAFPKSTFKCKIIRHKCRMCTARPASLVTVNDFFAGETPAYFCDQCYNQYHYDNSSNLIYDNFQ
ncbi:18163_t:CDS:2, partial [Funneliformis geosporum]